MLSFFEFRTSSSSVLSSLLTWPYLLQSVQSSLSQFLANPFTLLHITHTLSFHSGHPKAHTLLQVLFLIFILSAKLFKIMFKALALVAWCFLLGPTNIRVTEGRNAELDVHIPLSKY